MASSKKSDAAEPFERPRLASVCTRPPYMLEDLRICSVMTSFAYSRVFCTTSCMISREPTIVASSSMQPSDGRPDLSRHTSSTIELAEYCTSLGHTTESTADRSASLLLWKSVMVPSCFNMAR